MVKYCLGLTGFQGFWIGFKGILEQVFQGFETRFKDSFSGILMLWKINE